MNLSDLLSVRRQFLSLEGVTVRVERPELDTCLTACELRAQKSVVDGISEVAKAFELAGINCEMPKRPTTGNEAVEFAKAVQAIASEHYKDRDVRKPTETDTQAISMMIESTKSIGDAFDRLEELGVLKMRKHFDKIDFPVYFTIDEAEALGLI